MLGSKAWIDLAMHHPDAMFGRVCDGEQIALSNPTPLSLRAGELGQVPSLLMGLWAVSLPAQRPVCLSLPNWATRRSRTGP